MPDATTVTGAPITTAPTAPSEAPLESLRTASERYQRAYDETLKTWEPILRKTRERELGAAEGVTEAGRGVEKAAKRTPPPMPTTEPQPPIPPETRARPFLSPETVTPLQGIVQTLGLLATVIAGRGAPVYALKALTGAMRGWREGDTDRANRSWQTYLATVDRIREDNRQAMQAWEMAMREAGMDTQRARMVFVTKLAEAGQAERIADLAQRDMTGSLNRLSAEWTLARDLTNATLAFEQKRWTQQLAQETLKSREAFQQATLGLKAEDIAERAQDRREREADRRADQQQRQAEKHLSGQPYTDWSARGIVGLNPKGEEWSGDLEARGHDVIGAGYKPVKQKVADDVRSIKRGMRQLRNMREMAWYLADKGKLLGAAKAAQQLADEARQLPGDEPGALGRLMQMLRLRANTLTKDSDVAIWLGMESELISVLRNQFGDKGNAAMRIFTGALGTMTAPDVHAVDGYVRNLETAIQAWTDPYFHPALREPIMAIKEGTPPPVPVVALPIEPGAEIPKGYRPVPDFLLGGR